MIHTFDPQFDKIPIVMFEFVDIISLPTEILFKTSAFLKFSPLYVSSQVMYVRGAA